MKPLLTKVELLNTIPDDFPFLHLYPLEFRKNITVITGENGSGKSTILEALALKFGCSAARLKEERSILIIRLKIPI
ncbi:AAA family ATPase [Acinetobacter haemolyticus]|uniref:AAA family ATPase n=1 Tax=Acinetobacter haemolyticus TaxID=29430 RepID=UPI001D193B01|nr:AAA family ATPase [Acinetobacter haemolyticus]WHR57699.1 AAA family ATPase [Acinetobacter haemolyticus]